MSGVWYGEHMIWGAGRLSSIRRTIPVVQATFFGEQVFSVESPIKEAGAIQHSSLIDL